MTTPTRKSIAIHEAGHAVAHWAQGVRFADVGIRMDGRNLGGVGWTRTWYDPATFDPDVDLAGSAAGVIAEALVLRVDPRVLWRRDLQGDRAARHDLANARAVLAQYGRLPDGGWPALIDYLAGEPARRARELLLGHEREWQALARVLVTRDRVTWGEFLGVARACRDPRP